MPKKTSKKDKNLTINNAKNLQKANAIVLEQLGVPYRRIGKMLGVSVSTAHKWVQDFKEGNTNELEQKIIDEIRPLIIKQDLDLAKKVYTAIKKKLKSEEYSLKEVTDLYKNVTQATTIQPQHMGTNTAIQVNIGKESFTISGE